MYRLTYWFCGCVVLLAALAFLPIFLIAAASYLIVMLFLLL